MALLDAVNREHLHERSAPQVRTPEDRAALLRAAELVERYDASTEETRAQLVPAILDAIGTLLEAKGAIARSYGASWLWQLSAVHLAAADRLRASMASRHARSRLIIVQYAGLSGGFRIPGMIPLLKEVLRLGLRDRSAAVRTFSADRVQGFVYVDMLPELERALESEQNAKTRRSLEWSRDVLAHGFCLSSLQPSPDKKQVAVSIRTRGSYPSASVPNSLIEQFGMPEIARRVRAREHDRTIPGDRFDPLPPGYEHAGAWPESMFPPPDGSA
jgi:hypothetical protein